MKLFVGFITYNEASAKYLESFLVSLQAALSFLSTDKYQIVAFDNSDADYNINRLSVEHFNHRSGANVGYLSLGKNLGFSRAYNILISEALSAGAKYFLSVNPDMIFEPDFLEKLLTVLEKDEKLGSVSPKLLRWDFVGKGKTKQIDSCGIGLKSGLRFFDVGQGEEDRGQYNKAEIIGPSGAAGLYRLSALEGVKDEYGYFDERFFMYKEDCDLAYRLNRAGFNSCLVPAAIAYHDRTAAFYGRHLIDFLFNRRQMSRQVRSWSFLNQHLIFKKHYQQEPFFSRLIIVSRIVKMFIFSLILEKFNLKNYCQLIK